MATRILSLWLVALTLAGCITAATSAVTETAYVGAQERSVSDAGSDARILMLVDDKLFKYKVDLYRAVDTRVVEGRVLLTGNVATAQDRVKAAELTWQVPDVRQVINELQVRNDTGAGNYTRDSWILAKVRTQLLFAKGILSINYTTDCVDGVVYVMGVAQDEVELGRVKYVAQHVDGVKDVVSYVRLKSDLPNPLVPAKPPST